MRENHRQSKQWLVHGSALFLILLFIVLGGWQISRGNFKASLHEAVQPANESNVIGLSLPLDNPVEWRYRNVRVYGRYLPEKQLLLDNQIRGPTSRIQCVNSVPGSGPPMPGYWSIVAGLYKAYSAMNFLRCRSTANPTTSLPVYMSPTASHSALDKSPKAKIMVGRGVFNSLTMSNWEVV